MKKFKIKQIKEAEYENAKLSFNISLPMGPGGSIPAVLLSYTCPKCAGYGCGSHGVNTHCDDMQDVEIQNLKQSIGEEQTQHLINYLSALILKIKNN